jgi:fimbrial chaperone protein
MLRMLPVFSPLVFLLMLPSQAWAAGFGINATRLIYAQDADSISVTVRNTTKAVPYLVQVRVTATVDGQRTAPFQVRPPLFRMEPDTTNQIRIVRQGTKLPADRESVFYFQATAIPASSAPRRDAPQNDVNGMARFGVGNTIKLFYRPSGLPSTSQAAQRGLQFSHVKGGLAVRNPSPYHINFATVTVGGQKLKLETPADLMLAPFGQHTFSTSVVSGSVRWQTINDEGGVDAFTQDLP